MLLPGCDRCGTCGCVCGKLPYTLTVQFSGLVNRTHSTYCPLLITSDFGCGAEAVATAPGGCDADESDCGSNSRGPLSGVLLTEPGHDYARRGRKTPTLTLTGSGTGATFTPTLEAVDGSLAAQCRSYRVASVAVTGGTGYADGEQLKIVADGLVVTKAVAVLHTNRVAPTVTATAPGGTGATLTVTLTSTGSGSSQEWHVASVAVSAGGTGYTNGAAVAFAVQAGETTVTAASATIAVSSEPDDVNGGTWDTAGGTGATVSTAWVASGGSWDFQATLTNGGTGYAVGDYIWWYSTGSVYYSEYTVTAVDGSGTITAIDQTGSSPWPSGPGPIASVTVDDGGSYHADSGVPSSVSVTTAGEYYTEDPTAAVCVATVTIDASGCGGTGAVLSATIDADPTSATFGQITGITIDDGGAGYLCWHWLCTNQSDINGEPFVVVASDPKRLVTLEVESCFGSGACVRVVPTGSGEVCDPPVTPAYDGGATGIAAVEVTDGGGGYATFGREVPTWVALAYGWSFTPTWGDAFADDCERSLWSVESFSIAHVDGTHSQLDGWALTWAVTHPEHSDKPFAAIVRTRQSPTVTASAAAPGSGAALTVNLEEIGGQPKRWRVASVTVDDGGSGYSAGAAVAFAVAPRSGVWGHYVQSQAMGKATVGEGGAITGVTLSSHGVYYLDDGIPQSVEVLGGGRYYRENPALTPYVATPTVNVVQLPPSAGSGAAVSVVVGSDTGNLAEFGKILSASITASGSGYTLLGGPQDCSYESMPCGPVGAVFVNVNLRGNGKAPEVVLTDNRVSPGTTAVLRCDAVLGDCDRLPTTANLFYGAPAGVTATIARGGAVETPCADPAWCSTPQCYAAMCGCEIDSTWLYVNDIAAWEAANPGWTFPIIPLVTGGVQLPQGAFCEQLCRENIWYFAWEVQRADPLCTIVWEAWYVLDCASWDAENECGVDCSLTLVHEQYTQVGECTGAPELSLTVGKPAGCP